MPYPEAKYPPTGLALSRDEAHALFQELDVRIHDLNTWIHRASIGIRHLDDPAGMALHVSLLQMVKDRLASMGYDDEADGD